MFVIILALGGQIVGEIVALNTGEWAYNAAMPLIPGLRVGLTPALQMVLLILLTFWLAQRAARSSTEGDHPSIPVKRRGRKRAKLL